MQKEPTNQAASLPEGGSADNWDRLETSAVAFTHKQSSERELMETIGFCFWMFMMAFLVSSHPEYCDFIIYVLSINGQCLCMMALWWYVHMYPLYIWEEQSWYISSLSWYTWEKSHLVNTASISFKHTRFPLNYVHVRTAQKKWLIRSRATCALLMNPTALIFLHIKKSVHVGRGHHQIELARHLLAIV